MIIIIIIIITLFNMYGKISRVVKAHIARVAVGTSAMRRLDDE